MVANSTPLGKQEYTIPLEVLVDKEKNNVVFAVAGKDFVDVLLSFLTLPLGTIAKTVAKESNVQPVKVGSLSSMYESMSHFEEKHLWTKTCKEMLLQPRNSMEDYCQQLKLNIDDTEPKRYYFCENWSECIIKPPLVTTFRNQRCRCGKLMNRVLGSSDELNLENGFVKEIASFIVSDDLYITPNVFGESVNLFQKLGIEDMEAVEERIVDISKKEVVDLLKFSLISRTPLTDLFLRKEQYVDNFNPINQNQFEIGKTPCDKGRQMVLKIQIRKSNGKILFAEAEEEFVDFLFSFLTFPLGGVLHMLEGFSSVSCIDKLYRSMNELSSDRYLTSQGIKEKLANPPCAPQFNLNNQILPIGAESFPFTYSFYGRSFNIVDPKSSAGESSSLLGFVKGPAMYMVTDDLVVTPMSSISAVSYLKRLPVPLSDMEERVITIGVKEGLGILKASLTSTFALTNGLKHFIKTTEENGPITSAR
ncbi:uncharacterized protein [Glycine max]|uniref:uncharacterized protein n=1 Tax=Glycine max TaxID=3847 RepID=UPI0007192247|nr:uncharacterized protein LOC102660035 [Glycine max]|eukprot:XP_014626177.1 uncharacterized protein LOC102660035 [Glycine max]